MKIKILRLSENKYVGNAISQLHPLSRSVHHIKDSIAPLWEVGQVSGC